MIPADDPYGVPTGAVPRVQAAPAPQISADRDAALLKVLDDYEAMRRDAARWRALGPQMTWAWGGEGKVNWYAQIEMPEPDVSEGNLRRGGPFDDLGKALDGQHVPDR
jgi:hypothetical protein